MADMRVIHSLDWRDRLTAAEQTQAQREIDTAHAMGMMKGGFYVAVVVLVAIVVTAISLGVQ
jgi:glycine/serine hydroxymethyltransferase